MIWSTLTRFKDIPYILRIFKKADVKPALPGIHVKYSIDRGISILVEPDNLKKEIISAIIEFKPILDFLSNPGEQFRRRNT